MAMQLVLRVDGTDDELDVVRMRGREAISELFEITLDIATRDNVELPDEVKQGVSAQLSFMNEGTEERVIHGLLSEVGVVVDGGRERPTHRVVLAPRAFRASLIKTQQIFMDSSDPDLMKKKLGLVGLGEHIRMNLLGDYAEREFIVQYDEDDVSFVSRLAEHLGIAFHFDHRDDADTIVFSDHNGGFSTIEGMETLTISDRIDEPNTVTQLMRKSRMIPRAFVVYDYNYRTPDVSLKHKRVVEEGQGGGILEHGNHVKTPAATEALANIRAEERLCRQDVYEGESAIYKLASGMATQVEEHGGLPAQNLLITEVEHIAEPAGDGGALRYHNRFRAVSSDRTFRPERKTPRPRIHGIVTGIVQGPEGSHNSRYAMLDDEGRYLIEFHFDAGLNSDTRASRPVRMAQPLAGASEGMHFPLKPGVEVALAFANGDPDRPIILGALPNHGKKSVVTSTDAQLNRIETNSGIMIQFGSKSSR